MSRSAANNWQRNLCMLGKLGAHQVARYFTYCLNGVTWPDYAKRIGSLRVVHKECIPEATNNVHFEKGDHLSLCSPMWKYTIHPPCN